MKSSSCSTMEAEEEDQFSRLPDDLFILILTKLHQQHFKFLSQCSLISKRFSSLIPLMPYVSISISPPNPNLYTSQSSSEDVADRFIDRKMHYLTSLRPQIQNALQFLKKFNNIRSLDVVFEGDDEIEAGEGDICYGFLPSLINWKTKFDFKLQSFVFLFAQSVIAKSEQATENEAMAVHQVTSEQLELRLYSSFHGVVDSIEWGSVLLSLLVQHQMLHRITIEGSKKGGKICLRDGEIVDLRNSLTPEDIVRIGGSGVGVTINVKSGHVPILNLPLSGYAMKGVSLVVVRVGRKLCDVGEVGVGDDSDSDFDNVVDSDDDDDNDNDVEYDDDDIISWDFDEEEKVFREAVASILINHKDKMHRET